VASTAPEWKKLADAVIGVGSVAIILAHWTGALTVAM
jgi:hypothetical protein